MAAEELRRVRALFVQKVSREILYQLLDSLLEERILNDGEKDSIIEENATKNNKARALIDTVRNKGAEASRKFIAHLQREDLTLYSELGLSSVQSAQSDAQVHLALGSSAKPSSMEEFWKSKQNDPHVYTVTKESYRNRVALLITNIEFTDKSMNRKGAEEDQKNMEKLLSSLGYEVVKYTDLTGKAIDEAFIQFSQHPKLNAADSVIVVIMSHGKLGKVLGVNWKFADEEPDEFPINNIYRHLGSQRCPALLNKPKIIIIQACRGEQKGSVLVSDDIPQSVAEEGWNEDAIQWVHKEKDFISLLSCTPDTVSYRQTDLGSLLIQYVVAEFNAAAQQDPIQELFRKVMLRFQDFQVHDKRQMATIDRTTLIKHFFFFPGL